MRLVHDRVNRNWSSALPEAFYRAEKGQAVIQFDINRDGKIANVFLETSSGNDSLDQAARDAIRSSDPLTPLPPAFKGPHIRLRCSFYYNLPTPLSDCNAAANGVSQAPPFDRLELVAFVAGQNRSAYEAQQVCQRGINFTVDSSFLAALRLYGAPSVVVSDLENFKPHAIKQPSPERVSA
jgi:TonB family protein